VLTDNDMQYIKDCLQEIAPDTEQPIIYRQYTGTVQGDEALGEEDQHNYSDLSTTAEVREITLEEISQSGGTLVLGDVEFVIRLVQPPRYDDRIVWDGDTYRPKSIKKIWLKEALAWKVVGTKV